MKTKIMMFPPGIAPPPVDKEYCDEYQSRFGVTRGRSPLSGFTTFYATNPQIVVKVNDLSQRLREEIEL